MEHSSRAGAEISGRRLAPIAAATASTEAETWCIFDNTAAGAAIEDALILHDLLNN
jgi:uncharacterized protein YecE (DUF72 family)